MQEVGVKIVFACTIFGILCLGHRSVEADDIATGINKNRAEALFLFYIANLCYFCW